MASVLPYLTHPLFLSTVAGLVAPFVHWFFRSLGVDFTPKLNFLLNVALSGLAFLSLLQFVGNPTDAETFWLAFGTAAAVSKATYTLLVKGMEGPAIAGSDASQ